MHALRALALCLALCASMAATALANTWKIDRDHSAVTFQVRHIYVMVPGRFDRFSGVVQFDPARLGASRFDISVDTASVNTMVAKRDDHLRSADFFEASRYPAMRFESDSIEHMGQDKYMAHGQLTIKDVTKKVSIPFTFFGSKDNPMQQGSKVAGFQFDFDVNLVEYHVSDGRFTRMGLVGDVAKVTVFMEALR